MPVIKSEALRRLLRVLVPALLIPGLVVLGAVFVPAQRTVIVSLGVTALALILFASGYDSRLTGSRRMVIAAVMTALGVAGRFIPLFKPVSALTIISGMWLGGETGFLVGALSAVISNMFFGQGPWTPFQMLAWGLIGLGAGALAPMLKKSRPVLLVYGFVTGAGFSMIMDIWTVMWSGALTAEGYLAAMVTALPHTLLYGASNVLYLWLLARPFGEKLERVRVKYGV